MLNLKHPAEELHVRPVMKPKSSSDGNESAIPEQNDEDNTIVAPKFTPINPVPYTDGAEGTNVATTVPDQEPEQEQVEQKAERIDLGGGKYGCTNCEKQYDTKNNANRHIKEHNVTACCVMPECSEKRFHRSDKLQLHWRTRHSTLDRTLIKDELLKFYKNKADDAAYFWLNGTTHTRRSPKKKLVGIVEGVDFSAIAARHHKKAPPEESFATMVDEGINRPSSPAPTRPGPLGMTYVTRSTQTHDASDSETEPPSDSEDEDDAVEHRIPRIKISNFDAQPWDVRTRDPLETELLMMAGMRLDPKTHCLYDAEDEIYEDDEAYDSQATASDIEMADLSEDSVDSDSGDDEDMLPASCAATEDRPVLRTTDNIMTIAAITNNNTEPQHGKKRPSLDPNHEDPATEKKARASEPAMRSSPSDDEYDY